MSATREMPLLDAMELEVLHAQLGDRSPRPDEASAVLSVRKLRELLRGYESALVLAADLERVERELAEERALHNETHERIPRIEAMWRADLAACQAQIADARELIARYTAHDEAVARDFDNKALVESDLYREAQAILARPLDRSALDAMLLRVANDGWSAGFGVASMIRDGHTWYSTQENECAAIVASVLKMDAQS